jgi:hypothetical protein
MVQPEGPLEGENRLAEPRLKAAPKDSTGPGHWLKLGDRDLSGWLNIAKGGSTLTQINPLEDCAWGYALTARNSNKSSSLQV